ncbi:hypothetical protein B0H14DRAFT_3031829 [Mycena olivaceomarginata]|nr:hypothetical protein B0H14DRAFT_3031829 [Mycena olivaceomarginata]
MLYQQFKDCSQYHRWSTFDNSDGLEATICVKREPIGICLTIPGLELEWDVDKIERMASHWHSPSLNRRVERDDLKRISTIIAPVASPRQLSQHFDWSEFFAALAPAWLTWQSQWKNHKHWFHGSVVKLSPPCESPNPLISPLPVAYIPNDGTVRFKEWTQGWPMKSAARASLPTRNQPPWQRPGELKTTGASQELFPLSTYIQLNKASTDILDISWLVQANACVGPAISDGKKMHDASNGIAREVYLSVPPLVVQYEDRGSVSSPPQSDSLYWSLDPAGNTRLSLEECDSLGIPRLRLYFIRAAKCWREYHYNAICDFTRAKGFDPHTLICQSALPSVGGRGAVNSVRGIYRQNSGKA